MEVDRISSQLSSYPDFSCPGVRVTELGLPADTSLHLQLFSLEMTSSSPPQNVGFQNLSFLALPLTSWSPTVMSVLTDVLFTTVPLL